MRHPDFFIIGAPKCGTSSLAHYLSEHPQVFFSTPKEPNYWCDDFPRLKQFHQMQSLDRYLRLFEAATEDHIAAGEGSTNYFFSSSAVSNILAFNPDARFLVMLRNPVQAVYAMHGTLLFAMNETVRDFHDAWRLQQERAEGRRIPATCLAPQFLQYRQMFSYAEQIERLFDLVPESQRHVIVFDDFAADVARCYAQTLSFLNLPADGRTEFPVINSAKRQRLRWLHRILRRPPRWLERPMLPVRRFLTSRRTGVLGHVKNLLRVEGKRSQLDPLLVDELQNCFRHDVTRLSKLLHRDLSHWTDPRAEKQAQRIAGAIAATSR